MMDQQMTFRDLVDRFGRDGATDLLRCIERMAAIQSNIVVMDRDRRLQQALHALNDNRAGSGKLNTRVKWFFSRLTADSRQEEKP